MIDTIGSGCVYIRVVTVIVMCMVQYSTCHHTCAVSYVGGLYTETEEFQQGYIIVVLQVLSYTGI